MQLLSNDEGVDGFYWTAGRTQDIRDEMDEILDQYPNTVISSKYYHQIITTGEMMGRPFGWNECPSVTEPLDRRNPPPQTADQFHPMGVGPEDHASLLYI